MYPKMRDDLSAKGHQTKDKTTCLALHEGIEGPQISITKGQAHQAEEIEITKVCKTGSRNQKNEKLKKHIVPTRIICELASRKSPDIRRHTHLSAISKR